MAVNGFPKQREPGGAHALRGAALARVLVAVAIVAIVGTVAVPISKGHLDTTHTAQAMADLGAIEIAIARFKAQNRGMLPENLSQLRVGVWLDPWGNPYRYVNLETRGGYSPRHDYNGYPLNRDYDLFSVGKDGRTAASLMSSPSRDDVIRGLSGSFFGEASEYPGH